LKLSSEKYKKELEMGKKVLVPIADGIEEIEAVTIIDTLRRAESEVTVASVGDLSITASRGVKITADTLLSDCMNETFDLIALPGGLPGAEHLRDCEDLIQLLKAQKSSGRLYAAICASPAVALHTHGLLDGKKATCYPSVLSDLTSAQAMEEAVVVDAGCITSQGPGTALEFALKLVELLFDKEKADTIAAAMLAK
jgi:4-methyl-5(b-hydroxyethyl)-thiazole monophosphate biosynthesis